MTSDQLRKAIADLASIDREGLLSELRIAIEEDWREAGGCPATEERAKFAAIMDIGADFKSHELARIASNLLGVPIVQCEKAARDVLVVDPWAKIALAVIAEYLPTPKPVENKPTRRRNW